MATKKKSKKKTSSAATETTATASAELHASATEATSTSSRKKLVLPNQISKQVVDLQDRVATLERLLQSVLDRVVGN